MKVALGPKQTSRNVCSMSAVGGILLQKSKIYTRQFSRQRTIRRATGDLCDLSRVTEVDRELSGGR